jgi:hypothetical protein
MTTKPLILNFAKGSWYGRGQQRLLRSLEAIDGKTKYDVWAVDDESRVENCPAHSDAPYAFKAAMFTKAYAVGYRGPALWLDAAMFACRPLQPVFDHITSTGHLLISNGIVGQWASDAALASFGVDRDTAMNIVECMGCCLGLDLSNALAVEFLRRWREKSLDGVTFPGSWTNDQGQVSKDPRCRGHRHDQTAASLVSWQLGLPRVIGHEVQHAGGVGLFQYFENKARTPWVEGAANDMSKIGSGVCLMNQGL